LKLDLPCLNHKLRRYRSDVVRVFWFSYKEYRWTWQVRRRISETFYEHTIDVHRKSRRRQYNCHVRVSWVIFTRKKDATGWTLSW